MVNDKIGKITIEIREEVLVNVKRIANNHMIPMNLLIELILNFYVGMINERDNEDKRRERGIW